MALRCVSDSVYFLQISGSCGGPAWTRTRDLFLIREARCFSEDIQGSQNTCKYPYFVRDTFLTFSGYLPGLLHGCCTPLYEIALRIALTGSAESGFLSS